MKVRAPKGYHWMKQRNGSYKIMKHGDKFVKHKGASLTADFPVQKKHKAKLCQKHTLIYAMIYLES